MMNTLIGHQNLHNAEDVDEGHDADDDVQGSAHVHSSLLIVVLVQEDHAEK